VSSKTVDEVQKGWATLSNVIFVPHTEQEYEQIVALLDELIDEVGEDDTHPLASLMEVLGTLIEKYESDSVPELGGPAALPSG